VHLAQIPQRDKLSVTTDIYWYQDNPDNTLVVDFANRHVGGDCFGTALVQEEQLVLQSNDLAYRLGRNREYIEHTDAVSYQNIHTDVWWPKETAAKKERIRFDDILPPLITTAHGPSSGCTQL
jgi:hypothetical protein